MEGASERVAPLCIRDSPHKSGTARGRPHYQAMDKRFQSALGQAVTDSWGELPQEIQHLLFERAVVAGHQGEPDESLREQLAVFLHDIHHRAKGPVSSDVKALKQKVNQLEAELKD